jgi:hypothetical protein
MFAFRREKRSWNQVLRIIPSLFGSVILHEETYAKFILFVLDDSGSF